MIWDVRITGVDRVRVLEKRRQSPGTPTAKTKRNAWQKRWT